MYTQHNELHAECFLLAARHLYLMALFSPSCTVCWLDLLQDCIQFIGSFVFVFVWSLTIFHFNCTLIARRTSQHPTSVYICAGLLVRSRAVRVDNFHRNFNFRCTHTHCTIFHQNHSLTFRFNSYILQPFTQIIKFNENESAAVAAALQPVGTVTNHSRKIAIGSNHDVSFSVVDYLCQIKNKRASALIDVCLRTRNICAL